MAESKDFVDFILAAQKNRALLEQFLKAGTAEELRVVFGTGYPGMGPDDIPNLIKAKAAALGSALPTKPGEEAIPLY